MKFLFKCHSSSNNLSVCEHICAEACGSPRGSSHHAASLLRGGFHTAALVVVTHPEVVADLVGHGRCGADGQLRVVLWEGTEQTAGLLAWLETGT